MRRTALTCLGFASLAIATLTLGTTATGCTSAPRGENVVRAMEPIQGGTKDTTDSAVVAILINSPQGMSLCSGSLIAPNLILSAHHCVADSGSTACSNNSFGTTYAATKFMVTTSPTAAATIFNGSGTFPTADGVTWWAVNKVSVPGNNICGQDMSVLQLSSPISGVCPLIPRVDTEIADNDGYTAIGFGITSPNGQTAGTRYKVTGMTVSCVTDCNDPTQSSTQEWLGVASTSKGTCEGDSGGPAIDSAGRVIGTVSRGPSNACNQTVYESVYGEATWIKSMASAAATAGGYTAAGWVTGASTSNAANGYCGGGTTSSSSSSSSSSTSSSTSSSGSTGTVPTTCNGADGYQGCCADSGDLYYCSQTASGTSTPKHVTCPAGQTCGWNATGGYYDCVTGTAGADPSGTYPQYCGGSATTSSSSSGTTSSGTTSSSSGGANQCTGATPTGDATCDACIDASCCDQLVACANDSTCQTCAGSASPASSCASDQPYVDLINCLGGTCGTACGASSSSSSSSSGTTSSSGGTSTSSSGGASSSGGTGGAGSSSGIFGGGGQGTGGTAGTGATGSGNSGTGASHGGLGNNPGNNSGCSVAPSGTGGDPTAPASLAGLLFGAALMVSRRRR